jgi:phosphoribosyl 1,2-cyclic phosphate phosphodiesterase
MFSYAFSKVSSNGSKPKFTLTPIDGKLSLSGMEIIPVDVMHGQEKVTAYRFDKLAYVTDVSQIPQDSMDKLMGLDILIIDALRNIPHEKHFSIEQAISIVSILKPKQTFFTHIAHDIEHEETNNVLPSGIKLAYDGLSVEV